MLFFIEKIYWWFYIFIRRFLNIFRQSWRKSQRTKEAYKRLLRMKRGKGKEEDKDKNSFYKSEHYL
jgi:hypothetical protein